MTCTHVVVPECIADIYVLVRCTYYRNQRAIPIWHMSRTTGRSMPIWYMSHTTGRPIKIWNMPCTTGRAIPIWYMPRAKGNPSLEPGDFVVSSQYF